MSNEAICVDENKVSIRWEWREEAGQPTGCTAHVIRCGCLVFVQDELVEHQGGLIESLLSEVERPLHERLLLVVERLLLVSGGGVRRACRIRALPGAEASSFESEPRMEVALGSTTLEKASTISRFCGCRGCLHPARRVRLHGTTWYQTCLSRCDLFESV